jgi:hypothetical protein
MARALFKSLRLDRSVVVRTTHAGAERQDQEAWRRLTPLQRLRMVETLRQMNHSDYDPATTLLSRVYTITQPASARLPKVIGNKAVASP